MATRVAMAVSLLAIKMFPLIHDLTPAYLAVDNEPIKYFV
jgi:hypothetical protein